MDRQRTEIPVLYFNIEDAESVGNFLRCISATRIPVLIHSANRSSQECLRLFGEMLTYKGIPFEDQEYERLIKAQEAICLTRPDLYALAVILEPVEHAENTHGPEYKFLTPEHQRQAKFEPQPEKLGFTCALNCGRQVSADHKICPACSRVRQRDHHFHQKKWRTSGGRK